MAHVDEVYADMIASVLASGEVVTTRNATVRRLFARTCVFDSTPLVSLRKTAWKVALREWEWFMSCDGSSNIKDAHPSVHPWWKPWADKEGHVWGNYGEQFRFAHGYNTGEFDQIAYLIDGIRDHPFSRRNLVTTWNAAEMASKKCPITNCHHSLTQCFVDLDNRLHMVTYQRSADVIVGLPANWIQTWAFLTWLASRTGRTVGTLTWIGGDVHVYDQHEDLARRMLRISIHPDQPATPQLVYTPTSEDFKADDFTLDGVYTPMIVERADMVV